MTFLDAAFRLVERPRSDYPGGAAELVDVVAAFLVERDRPGTARAIAEACRGRPAAAALATGVLMADLSARSVVEESFAAIPDYHRSQPIVQLAPILARLDLEWAWTIIAPEVRERGGAAQLALLAVSAGLDSVELPASVSEMFAPFRHLRVVLRNPAASAQESGPGLSSPVFHGRAARSLWLAGEAITDPQRAVDNLARHRAEWPIADFTDVLVLAAQTASARAQGRAFVDAMPADLSGAEEATWLHAAVEAGILQGSGAALRIRELVPRIEDSCDPGDEPAAGYPVIAAMARLGDSDAVIELADRWHMPPPMLAALLFGVADGVVTSAVIDAGGFERLFRRPEDEWWGHQGSWYSEWWGDVVTSASSSAQACRDVATIGPGAPWQFWPGSLDDFVDLVRREVAHESAGATDDVPRT